MSGHAKLYKIRNEVIRDKVGVAPLEDKMGEARLRWFEHIKRRSIESLARRCETLTLVGMRSGRGRPKKSWGEVIRRDMAQLELIEDTTLDRKSAPLHVDNDFGHHGENGNIAPRNNVPLVGLDGVTAIDPIDVSSHVAINGNLSSIPKAASVGMFDQPLKEHVAVKMAGSSCG
ncbi:PREDICTED: uncharacterized protein LOC109214696 [Nicotiana attenuata]|uniref:uncharacterized protein LOC109214696 n=1 Tax=Nicotiana attenuata TaxID=49451 RepID=UPI000905D591|nr:PREDICTED: uncharacterized protein LOC109214696 [Nicotiana attenuata]